MHTRRSPLLDCLCAAVRKWPGVAVVPHRFGGAEFRLGHIELGHVHADGTLDLHFPIPLRDRLIEEGWANIHHVLPASGWVTFYVAADGDVEQAVQLLRIAYLRRWIRLHEDDRAATLEVAHLDVSPELVATLLGRPPAPTSVAMH
jgi:hypothetical protein